MNVERKVPKKDKKNTIFAICATILVFILIAILLRFVFLAHVESEKLKNEVIATGDFNSTVAPTIFDEEKIEVLETDDELVTEKTKDSTLPTVQSQEDIFISSTASVTSTSTSTTTTTTTQAPVTETITTTATRTPTTTEPTTTTEVPTTEAPTTEVPTTEAPTTEAPTAEVPITEIPVELATKLPPTCVIPSTEHSCSNPVPFSKLQNPLSIFDKFTPTSLELNLTVSSLSFPIKFSGSALYGLKITTQTDTLIINAGATVNSLETQNLIVYDCSRARFVCVTAISRVMAQDIFVFQLSEPLPADSEVLFKFNKVSADLGPKSNAVHLQIPNRWQKGAFSSILTTSFSYNNARKIFPSFDNLKDKLDTKLCLTVQKELAVRANFELTEEVMENENRKSCFKNEGALSANQIAFSLYKDIQYFEDSTAFPKLELIISKSIKKHDFSQFFGEIRKVIAEMEILTNSSYPLPKLTFIASSINYDILSHPGLIVIKEYSMEYSNYFLTHTTLAKSIIQQWIGNMISVGSRNEICLQDGLATYLEWYISEKVQSITKSVSSRSLEAKIKSMRSEDNGFDIELLKEIKDLSDISIKCSNKSPLIFAMLHHNFGGSFLAKLITQVASTHLWSTIALPDISEATATVTSSSRAGALVNKFFTESGYPLLTISYTRGQSGIVIASLSHGNWSNFDMPVDVLMMEGKHKFAITASGSSAVPAVGSFVLGDPDDVLYGRVLYNGDNYVNMLNCVVNSNNCLEKQHIEKTYVDFCWGLMGNKLAFDQTKPDQRETWKATFKSFLAYNKDKSAVDSIHGNEILLQECNCCLNFSSTKASQSSQCKRLWKDKCRKIDVIKHSLSK